ncbi:MAG: sulfotransferase family 2 domain-containing protein [Leisingera sp.]
MRSTPDPVMILQKARLQETLGRPFIFIHVNKCGGTSVASALDILQIHGPVQTWLELYGREFVAAKRSFSVVRRPYERLCSMFRFRSSRGVAVYEGRNLELNEWIYRTLHLKDPGLVRIARMLTPAHEWMLDANGDNLVELVVRLEDIDKDWGKVQQLTGCKAGLPRLNTTHATPDTSVHALNSESRAIIEREFEADFQAFDYDHL